jgi:hypothetical protein
MSKLPEFMKSFKTLVFLLLSIHCTTTCICQVNEYPMKVIPPVVVPKAVQEDFLNNFQKALADRDLNACKLITFKEYDYIFLDKYRIPIAHAFIPFSTAEDQFISDQINKYEDEEHKKKDLNLSLKNLSLIPESRLQSLGTTYQTFWEAFHKYYGSVALMECSKPLFSKNFNYAVMEIGVSSNPASTFLKGVYVFKHVNAKWVYLKKLDAYKPGQKFKN